MTLKFIDVSAHNGNVDFEKVKSEGYDGVIIRAGFGRLASQVDKKFEVNYANAKRANLRVGAYWYSYATTANEAREEANACLEVIKGKQFDFPIYFDIEDKCQLKLKKSVCSDIVKVFCGEMEWNKYWVGIYSFDSFFGSHIDESLQKRYATWVARVDGRKPQFCKTYQGWQYSWTEKITGHKCDFDVSVFTVDYSPAIKQRGLNGYGKQSEKPQEIIPNTKYLVEYDKEQSVAVKDYNLASQGNAFLSPHFQVNEFKSPDSNTVKIDNRLVWVLERLFKDLDCFKMNINSGYRTPTYSVKVGGGNSDFHTKGQAADIKAYGKDGKVISAKIVCQKLCTYGDVFGIGYINAESVHVDTRPKANIWYGDETKGVSLIKQGYKDFDSYFNPKKTLTINAGTWNIRQSPNTASKIVCVVKGGEQYTFTAQMNNWSYIPSLSGWISPKGHTVNK